MTKSIETIWQQGFIDEKALVAPKINDLYNQKSQNVIDKLQRTFRLNNLGIIIGACLVLLVLSAFSMPVLGLFIAAILFSQVWISKKQLIKLERMDKNISSYQYIKSFDIWLKTAIAQHTRMYQFIYPALFVACITQFGFSWVGQSIIQGFQMDFPNIPVLFGVPIVFSAGVLFIAFLLSYFASAIYQLDMKPIYGREFKKLEEIITDMETLRV
ncbi:hypothetical protein [Cognaticolwellia mytili]|uniref:hypothetical protein n=1 Tax=Cognaticolwellia mytili TaxID=1888913 RepID=UPI000A174FAD|nr:hypothetical protein [Cognaticolwellia mytili]